MAWEMAWELMTRNGPGLPALPARGPNDRAAAVTIETSVQIAWDYLERSDEHGDIAVASRFLVGSIELLMVRRGERRRLLLANKAIDQYRRFINHDAARAREGRLHG